MRMKPTAPFSKSMYFTPKMKHWACKIIRRVSMDFSDKIAFDISLGCIVIGAVGVILTLLSFLTIFMFSLVFVGVTCMSIIMYRHIRYKGLINFMPESARKIMTEKTLFQLMTSNNSETTFFEALQPFLILSLPLKTEELFRLISALPEPVRQKVFQRGLVNLLPELCQSILLPSPEPLPPLLNFSLQAPIDINDHESSPVHTADGAVQPSAQAPFASTPQLDWTPILACQEQDGSEESKQTSRSDEQQLQRVPSGNSSTLDYYISGRRPSRVLLIAPEDPTRPAESSQLVRSPTSSRGTDAMADRENEGGVHSVLVAEVCGIVQDRMKSCLRKFLEYFDDDATQRCAQISFSCAMLSLYLNRRRSLSTMKAFVSGTLSGATIVLPTAAFCSSCSILILKKILQRETRFPFLISAFFPSVKNSFGLDSKWEKIICFASVMIAVKVCRASKRRII